MASIVATTSIPDLFSKFYWNMGKLLFFFYIFFMWLTLFFILVLMCVNTGLELGIILCVTGRGRGEGAAEELENGGKKYTTHTQPIYLYTHIRSHDFHSYSSSQGYIIIYLFFNIILFNIILWNVRNEQWTF